jgi:hypothetical protein
MRHVIVNDFGVWKHWRVWRVQAACCRTLRRLVPPHTKVCQQARLRVARAVCLVIYSAILVVNLNLMVHAFCCQRGFDRAAVICVLRF